MKHWFVPALMALASLLVACSEETTTTDVIAISIVDAGGDDREAVVVISEVFFGPDGYVAVTNHGEGDAVLDQWAVCQSSLCFPVPNMTLESGDTVVFAADESGGIEGNIVDMRRGAGDLDAASGEIALFSSRSVTPQDMVSYVGWGGRVPVSATAVELGLWSNGPVQTTEETAGIVKTTAVPLSADDWTVSS